MPEPGSEHVDEIRERLDTHDSEGVRRLVQAMHPADIADLLEALDEPERLAVMALLDDETAGEVLDETADDVSTEVIEDLGPERAAHILDELPADDAAEILTEIPQDEAQELIRHMESAPAADVRELLEYPDDTAGRLMTREFVAVRQNLTAQQAIERLRQLGPSAETAYYVYVVDVEGRLTGVLSLRDLIVSPPERAISEIMLHEVVSVEATTDQEEAANAIAKYDLLAVPVVDQGRLVGIVTVDDAIDVITDEATEDIYRLSGTTEEKEATPTVARSAMRRLPWILVALAGELITARVIKGYQITLEQIVALAFFIPVVMATGGTAGIQSLAVMMRTLTLGQVSLRAASKMIAREAGIGLLLGLVCGLIMAGIAWLWQGNPSLGLVVGVALAGALLVAAISGTFIPIALRLLKFDPALASGPLIMTLIDIIGVLIYFALAMTMLEHL